LRLHTLIVIGCSGLLLGSSDFGMLLAMLGMAFLLFLGFLLLFGTSLNHFLLLAIYFIIFFIFIASLFVFRFPLFI